VPCSVDADVDYVPRVAVLARHSGHCGGAGALVSIGTTGRLVPGAAKGISSVYRNYTGRYRQLASMDSDPVPSDRPLTGPASPRNRLACAPEEAPAAAGASNACTSRFQYEPYARRVPADTAAATTGRYSANVGAGWFRTRSSFKVHYLDMSKRPGGHRSPDP